MYDDKEQKSTRKGRAKQGAGGKPGREPNGKPGREPNGKPGREPNGKPGREPNGKPGRQPSNKPNSRPGSRIRSKPDPRLSRSLECGTAILESFSGERQALGIAEIADLVGISRSTTHRYAVTLLALGLLEQDYKHKYRLSNGAACPGSAAIGALRRQLRARGALEDLRNETGRTVSMGILDGARVVYVYRLLGHRAGQYAIDRNLGAGANVPVHCTALGKLLLASLSHAERRELLASLELTRHGPNSTVDMRGLVAELDRLNPRTALVSNEELVRGARSIAVLVPRPRGEPPAAIDVTVPSTAFTVARLAKEIGPRLERTARLISGE